MFQDIGDSLQVAFRDALSDFFGFIPNLIGAIILLLVGWFLGKLIGTIVSKALQAVGFNKVAAKAEIDDFLKNAGVKMDAASVVGAVARWFVYLVFFLAAFNALGLEEVSAVIDDVLTFLPKVIVAIIILLVGALAGTLLAGVVKGSLRSMGLSNPDLFGTIARFAVIAFAAIAALDMLEIAPTIVATLWQGLIFGVVGILVLAFGLGGREAARDLTLGRLLRAELEPGVEISAGQHQGTIRMVGTLFTTLETPQGVIKVPNTELTSQPVQMSQQAFQQQVQKRQEMKEKAKQAMESQQNGGPQNDGRPRSTPPTPTAIPASSAANNRN
jgi:hypothetical protein